MFQAFDASTSGLYSERTRMNAIANNLANVYTTRNEFGEKMPFRRRLVTFMEGNENNADPKLGVHVMRIVEDDAAPRLAYEPGHPDALRFSDIFELDANGEVTDQVRPIYQNLDKETLEKVTKHEGYVMYSNVDPVMELKDATMAARSYEANVAAVQMTKSMISESLSLLA